MLSDPQCQRENEVKQHVLKTLVLTVSFFLTVNGLTCSVTFYSFWLKFTD